MQQSDSNQGPLPGHPVREDPPRLPSRFTGPRPAPVLVGFVALLLLVAALLLPRYLLAWDLRGESAPADPAAAVNAVRSTLFQALAGGAVLLGAYLTWRQLNVARESHLTGLFTQAVGQIGDSSLDVRIGGLYGLQRIALDSAKDQPAVQEILSAFIRQRLPHANDLEAQRASVPAPVGLDKRALAWQVETCAPLRVRAADVQAAITILTEYPRTANRPPLRLSYVDLRRGDLRDAHLAEADLHYSDLSADLGNADLHLADLTGTRLLAANLVDANLYQADLREVIGWHARFDGADLRGTDLTGADLTGACLDRTRLDQADLRGADLSGIDLSTTHLRGAVANSATTWPAGFDPDCASVIMNENGPPTRPQTSFR